MFSPQEGTPEHYSVAAMSMYVRPELAVSPEVNYFVTSNPHFLYQVDRADAVQVLGDASASRNSVVTSVDWHPTQNSIVAGYADSTIRVTNFLHRAASSSSSRLAL